LAGVTNFGIGWSTGGYMEDTLGFVHLEGTFNCPAAATIMFVLPAGFRPGSNLFLSEANGAGANSLEIFTNGNVREDGGSTTCGIDGTVFPAAGTAGTSPVAHSSTSNPAGEAARKPADAVWLRR